jgi:hypothetical protein
MADAAIQSSRDWLGNIRTNMIAWWIPHAAILAALFIAVPARTGIWIASLVWMGTACMLNARRCGRTHCRYTGPYYFAMILLVLALGLSVSAANIYGWLVLGAAIVLGSKVIWWTTERAWGKFS